VVLNRRQLLKRAALGAALVAPRASAQSAALKIAGRDAELRISPVSANTFRISLLEVINGTEVPPTFDDSLVQQSWGAPVAKLRTVARAQTVRVGTFRAVIERNAESDPLTITIQNAQGATVQKLRIDAATGGVSFTTGDSPLLGLGEGGPQFDRRGSTDRMRSGQGGYQLRTHGGRVPIPWIVSPSGWALFIRQPFGTFDFTGAESKFIPGAPGPFPQGTAPPPAQPLPLDIFVVVSKDPAAIMAEYVRLTGKPELAPLWSFGYQQSHRTLASRDEIIQEAKTFREKKLPCDTMIYLGTGFCPSGWNTNNGEWGFNTKVFPDPKQIFDELHAQNMKVALHVVIRARSMSGTVRDACDPARPAEEQPSCYWDIHRPIFNLGVDGWWPDEGDPLNAASRLARNRMYWEAPQLDRPNERPFALHRNGSAGMQRFGSFLWSGDVYSTWETLKVHVPVAINTGLSGIPYWGTDIAGFVPTKEFTAEFYLRWFQFAAFCPLFRAHGRNWKLAFALAVDDRRYRPNRSSQLQWRGRTYCRRSATIPRSNRFVENISSCAIACCRISTAQSVKARRPGCRSCVRCGCTIPTTRLQSHVAINIYGVAMCWSRRWSNKVRRRDACTYRRELGTTFWTNEKHEGGSGNYSLGRSRNHAALRPGRCDSPAGSGETVRRRKGRRSARASRLSGADGSFLLYEDDGKSFNYRKGEWMGTDLRWNDRTRVLSLRLAQGFENARAGETKSRGEGRGAEQDCGV
jgi:alpha-glucosidase/alpha-D-xyloside xylohydrolase